MFYKKVRLNQATCKEFALDSRNKSCSHLYIHESSSECPYFSYKKTDSKVGFFSLYSGDSMLRVKVGLVVKGNYTQLPHVCDLTSM